MTLTEVMSELEQLGNEKSKKVLMRHGAREPFFGVKVQDLKTIQKKVKKDHELALQLYETGNSDAMYLAALIADAKQFTKETLNDWAEKAYWYMLSEYTVAWSAADSLHGWELAAQWIKSDRENIASAGWATYASLLTVTPDEDIDASLISELLAHAEKEIHNAQNRVRYTMNGFIIAVGTFFKPVRDNAKKVATKVGKVHVEMGGTSCKVPLAKAYIEKVEASNIARKKKKTAVC